MDSHRPAVNRGSLVERDTAPIAIDYEPSPSPLGPGGPRKQDHRMIRQPRWLLALLGAALAGGCAIKPIGPALAPGSQHETISDSYPVVGCDTKYEATACAAINLADGYRRAYLRRVSRTRGVRDAIGYTIIPLTTLALYYGVSDTAAYSQRIRRLGASAAGLYAMGQWGLPSSREAALLDGARAMTCAVVHMAPRILPKSEIEALKTAVEALPGQIDALRGQMRTIGVSGATISNRVEAEAALIDAEAALIEGRKLLDELRTSGIQLAARVRLIDIEVQRRYLTDSPSLDSLVSLATSLPGIATAFGVERVQQEKPEDVPAEALDVAARKPVPHPIDLTALKASTSAVRSQLHRAGTLTAAAAQVGECQVGSGAKFVASPDDTRATIKVGASYTVVVTDPVAHPSARLSGGQTDALELKPIELTGNPREYRIVVQAAKATTEGGLPVLAIRSASGLQGIDVSIQVKADVPTPNTKNNTSVAGTGHSLDRELAHEPAVVLALQCLIGTKPDCIMGPDTRRKLQQYRQRPATESSSAESIARTEVAVLTSAPLQRMLTAIQTAKLHEQCGDPKQTIECPAQEARD